MHLFLTYTILGLVIGAVYGIAASGLVLTYTTSGIFNFAQGAMAMLAAFTYWQFRYGWNWPAPLALVRRARRARAAPGRGPLPRHHAGAARHGRGDQDHRHHRHHARAARAGPVDLEPGRAADRRPVLRRARRSSGSSASTSRIHEVIALGCGVAHRRGHPPACSPAPAPAWPCGRWSTTRACSSSTADDRSAWPAFSWALGGALAALAGILITPISGGTLDVHVLTLLVLDAIAAAMFGRLRSIWRTFVGALVLGLAGTYVLAYFPSSWSWAVELPHRPADDRARSSSSLVLPQDRLRGATSCCARGSASRVPTLRSAVTLGRDPAVWWCSPSSRSWAPTT